MDLIILDRLLEYLDGIESYYPLMTFLYNPFISYALNGGLNVTISYITHPNDHISLLAPYGLSYHTSGDA